MDRQEGQDRPTLEELEYTYLSQDLLCPCGYVPTNSYDLFLHSAESHPPSSGQSYWNNLFSVRPPPSSAATSDSSSTSSPSSSSSSFYYDTTTPISPPTDFIIEPPSYDYIGPSVGMKFSDCFGYHPMEQLSSGMQDLAAEASEKTVMYDSSPSGVPARQATRMDVDASTSASTSTSTSTSASTSIPTSLPMPLLRARTSRPNSPVPLSSSVPAFKPFRCENSGCLKSWKNKAGRRYHYKSGKCQGLAVSTPAPTATSAPTFMPVSTAAPAMPVPAFTPSSSALPSASMGSVPGVPSANRTPNHYARSERSELTFNIAPPVATAACTSAIAPSSAMTLPHTFSVVATSPLSTVAISGPSHMPMSAVAISSEVPSSYQTSIAPVASIPSPSPISPQATATAVFASSPPLSWSNAYAGPTAPAPSPAFYDSRFAPSRRQDHNSQVQSTSYLSSSSSSSSSPTSTASAVVESSIHYGAYALQDTGTFPSQATLASSSSSSPTPPPMRSLQRQGQLHSPRPRRGRPQMIGAPARAAARPVTRRNNGLAEAVLYEESVRAASQTQHANTQLGRYQDQSRLARAPSLREREHQLREMLKMQRRRDLA